jgi:hypothetical protein
MAAAALLHLSVWCLENIPEINRQVLMAELN